MCDNHLASVGICCKGHTLPFKHTLPFHHTHSQGFRKVDPDRWEFANEHFLRDNRDALKDIHRRKPTGGTTSSTHRNQQAAIEVGQYGGLSDEIEALKRDKNILMMELVRIRQQQQNQERFVHDMQQRLQTTEHRQHNLMTFMAKMLQNPGFMQQVMTLHKQHEMRQISEGEPGVWGEACVCGGEASCDTCDVTSMGTHKHVQEMHNYIQHLINNLLLQTQVAKSEGQG